jgi:hypothetical protein
MAISELIAQLRRPIRFAIRKLSPSERRFERRMAAYIAACQQPAIDAHLGVPRRSSLGMRNHEAQGAGSQSDPSSLGLCEEDVLACQASEVLRYSEFLSDEQIGEKHGRSAEEIADLKAQAMRRRGS